MNHATHTKITWLVLLCLVVFSFTAFGQHVTQDEALRRELAERTVEELIETIQAFPDHDSQYFELTVFIIQQIGEKGRGNAAAVAQLQNSLQVGMDRVARINNRELDYWRIRAEAALALGKVGDRTATQALVNAAHRDKDIMVRMCAIRGLAMLRDPAAVPRLLDMLENTTIDRVAYEIVYALGEIGDRRALPMLLAATQRNFSQAVHRRAREAMRKLQN